MNNNKLIVLREKSSDRVNIFSISEDSKLIPLFLVDDDKSNGIGGGLLIFDKVLPYFDGIELILNEKYDINFINDEVYMNFVAMLDNSYFVSEPIVVGNSEFHMDKHSNKGLRVYNLKSYKDIVYYDRFMYFRVISKELFNSKLLCELLIKKILNDVYDIKVKTVIIVIIKQMFTSRVKWLKKFHPDKVKHINL